MPCKICGAFSTAWLRIIGNCGLSDQCLVLSGSCLSGCRIRFPSPSKSRFREKAEKPDKAPKRKTGKALERKGQGAFRAVAKDLNFRRSTAKRGESLQSAERPAGRSRKAVKERAWIAEVARSPDEEMDLQEK